MLKLERLYYTRRGFDLLAFLEEKNLKKKKTCIPCHFLYSNYEKHCTYFKPFFLVESTYFQRFLNFYLIEYKIARGRGSFATS